MKVKFNAKKFLLDHGEKIGLAVVGVVVLLGLAGADWRPYEGNPADITVKVNDGKRAHAQHQWPEGERKQFDVQEKDMPRSVVHANLKQSFDLYEYQFSTAKFFRTPFEQKEPLKEPKWAKLEDPLADAGRVLIATVSADSRASDPLLATPDSPEAAPADDSRPDEFRSRTPGAGVGTGQLGTGTSSNPYLGGPTAVNTGRGGPQGAQAGGRGRGNPPAAGNAGTARNRPAAGRGDSSGGLLGGDDSGGLFSGSPYGGSMAFGGGMGGQEGRGFPYVAVRAVFPVRDQITRIAQATSESLEMAAGLFEILDFDIERQTMQFDGEPWSGPWQPVDLNVTRDILEKISAGIEADVVAGQVTDPAITQPLPARISGVWLKHATHPRIEKFTLSEEQIQQEIELNEAMLMQFQEQQRQLPPPPAEKKGWSNLQTDAKQIRAMALGGGGGGALGGGGGSSYYQQMMGSMRMAPPTAGSGGGSAASMMQRNSSMMSGGGRSSMNMGPGRGSAPGRGPAGAQPPKDAPQIEELLNKLPEERREMMRKYIQDIVQVDGELLLFRYIDFSVEPGYTYRYRVRLVFRNPNFGRKEAEAGGDRTIVSGETRTSEWSDPTSPARVDKFQHYFVADVKSPPGRAYPVPRLNIYQWDTSLGTTQQAELDLALGQTVSGKVKTKVLDPAKQSFEEKDYTFQSTDFTVDALPDLALESSVHEIKPLGGMTRGDLRLDKQVLVATSEGDLVLLDPSAQEKQAKDQSDMLKWQNEDYQHLLEGRAPQGGLGGDLMDMYSRSGMGMGGAGRGANPLSRRGGGGRGMGSMGSMGSMDSNRSMPAGAGGRGATGSRPEARRGPGG
ncbi:MAG: hypothetical protein KF774_18800 [Planctomyces sp.]|nr:hypothetical protein [Planctomyces sp.]